MTPFSWALVILGVFLAAYAVLTLLRSAGASGGKMKQSVGCGFILLAGLIWGFALNIYLDGHGFALGFGVAFLLSALAVLMSGKRGFGRAIIPLVLGVILCATAFPTVQNRLKNSDSRSWQQKLEFAVNELRPQLSKTEALVGSLERERVDLARKLKAMTPGSFDDLSSNTAAYALLKELGEVDDLLRLATARAGELRANVDRVEGALRRVRRFAEAEAVLDIDITAADIERIVTESRKPLKGADAATVEQHLQTERLRTLFENEIQR